MSRRVQTLLKPTGLKSLGEVSINIPEELMRGLREILSFDVSGRNELENNNIPQAIAEFYGYAQNNALCEIWFYPDELGDNAKNLYILVPIEKAEEIILFIEDQISNRPKIETVNYLGMKEILENNNIKSFRENINGWFDLDTPAFMFKDYRSITQIRHFFGIEDVLEIPGHPLKKPDDHIFLGNIIANLPRINRFMEFQPEVGTIQNQAIPLMRRLANTWDKAISCPWNDGHLVVRPEHQIFNI